MSTWILINIQGTVYYTARRYADDDGMVQLYSKSLLNVTRDSTFDTLYSRVASKWHQQDDIVIPFNDRRQYHIKTVWIFDLDKDIIRFEKKDHHLQVPLHLVRDRSVTISDFKPFEAPAPLELEFPSLLSPPYWNIRPKGLDLELLGRRRALLSRIFVDFAFQWRHILCSQYNDSTFRKLASAVIRIATLDFKVTEVTTARQGIGGYLVWIHNLPEWDPFNEHIIRAGGASIVISRHIPHAIALIQEDFSKTISNSVRTALASPDESRTYLVLTVREIFLYRINSESVRYTKSKRLFDGYHPPSDEALDVLLQATQGSFPAPIDRLHRLPTELQDLILDNVSAGPIERARVGCMLSFGSNFTWRCDGRDIEREEGHK
ncbi:hypothetical protein GGR58DRAFT_15466 [Xylaria digitata]|nr:hypothetical protein GGR58DRAFT_15466 [Xylaria digitata]